MRERQSSEIEEMESARDLIADESRSEDETEWQHAARLFSTRVIAEMKTEDNCGLAEYKVATQLQLELLAALRSNREKDAQLAELKADLSQYAFIADAASTDLVSDRIHVIPKLKEQLAEKAAKIAELKQRCNTFMQGLEAEEKDCEDLHVQLEAAEARLAEKDARIVELEHTVKRMRAKSATFFA